MDKVPTFTHTNIKHTAANAFKMEVKCVNLVATHNLIAVLFSLIKPLSLILDMISLWINLLIIGILVISNNMGKHLQLVIRVNLLLFKVFAVKIGQTVLSIILYLNNSLSVQIWQSQTQWSIFSVINMNLFAWALKKSLFQVIQPNRLQVLFQAIFILILSVLG